MTPIPTTEIPAEEARVRPADPKTLPIPQPPLRSVEVLGIPFHCLTVIEALDRIENFVRERSPRQVSVANAYTLALCRKDEYLVKVLKKSDLQLADGMSVVWGALWIGVSLPQRVAGPDVMEGLCERAAKNGYRIFLMGSSPENLVQLSARLIARHPNLVISGLHSPPVCDQFDPEETERIIRHVRDCAPDILFVGVSAPKQEKWISENLHRLNVPVAMGVGAAFDFLSGRIPRAPRRLQEIGLEWLYRLYCEPRRLWKRYILGNVVFLSLLLKEAVAMRFQAFRKRTPKAIA